MFRLNRVLPKISLTRCCSSLHSVSNKQLRLQYGFMPFPAPLVEKLAVEQGNVWGKICQASQQPSPVADDIYLAVSEKLANATELRRFELEILKKAVAYIGECDQYNVPPTFSTYLFAERVKIPTCVLSKIRAYADQCLQAEPSVPHCP